MPYKDPAMKRANHTRYMKTYLSDPEHKADHLKRVARNQKGNRAALLAYVQKVKVESGGCLLCSEAAPCCLSFHHRDRSTKKFSISNGTRLCVSLTRLKAEIRKCVVICENCHRKVHSGLLVLPEALGAGA